ncbi:hypothetical protein RBB50_003347 [Rhinocladiella similis]
MPCCHQLQINPWLVFALGRLKPNKELDGTSKKNCARSFPVAALKPSKTSMGSPSGLVSVLSMSGGTALARTALDTRLVPWRPIRGNRRAIIEMRHLSVCAETLWPLEKMEGGEYCTYKTSDFTTTCRMSYHPHVFEVKVLNDGQQIVTPSIHHFHPTLD